MNGARTKLLITLGKIIIFYLSIAPWSRTKFYKLQVQKEKPAEFVYIVPPQGWSGTPLKGECVLCCIFTYKWDRS